MEPEALLCSSPRRVHTIDVGVADPKAPPLPKRIRCDRSPRKAGDIDSAIRRPVGWPAFYAQVLEGLRVRVEQGFRIPPVAFRLAFGASSLEP